MIVQILQSKIWTKNVFAFLSPLGGLWAMFILGTLESSQWTVRVNWTVFARCYDWRYQRML